MKISSVWLKNPAPAARAGRVGLLGTGRSGRATFWPKTASQVPRLIISVSYGNQGPAIRAEDGDIMSPF